MHIQYTNKQNKRTKQDYINKNDHSEEDLRMS